MFPGTKPKNQVKSTFIKVYISVKNENKTKQENKVEALQ